METIGFLLNIPGKGNVRIFGTLAQYTADNLGLKEAFGLVTSFNSDGCCALCYATRDEMRCFYHEHEFETRNESKNISKISKQYPDRKFCLEQGFYPSF